MSTPFGAVGALEYESRGSARHTLRSARDAPAAYTPQAMPGLYLAAILGSFAGVGLLDRRYQLGLRSRPTLVAVVVVQVAFLAFDLLGAGRGWFSSSPDWVIATWLPGIPLEEPLLLAFITLWAITLYRLAGRLTGEDGP
jgi:hypothetical protein